MICNSYFKFFSCSWIHLHSCMWTCAVLCSNCTVWCNNYCILYATFSYPDIILIFSLLSDVFPRGTQIIEVLLYYEGQVTCVCKVLTTTCVYLFIHFTYHLTLYSYGNCYNAIVTASFKLISLLIVSIIGWCVYNYLSCECMT